MGRYEIRNEFSLADPDLYRAADKDDPEALLEGVAMAGLVGVLRQLGDLAEFAAETFHDLHEEVLATAARGHGLMIRVQQLEAEVPSIEKAFLSQTDHSSFFNNAGVDWHPNLRMSQNLVTQGDLPRFIMDSYEECRGPPRLFLLDKFDVAGAGACLKRYTDPSFYKVEMSSMTNADVHRGRKVRKAKKKGPRGRNRETPEVQPISQANLHQFLLEEPVENGVSKPARRGKLKRRPYFSPFDSKTGRSYMEKFVKSHSPEHQMLREITEVPRPRSLSPCRESVETKEILPTDRDQNIPNYFKFEMDEVVADGKDYEVYNNLTDGIPSAFCEETGEKDIAVDGESKTEGYLTIYQSDEVASEMDNFVDAPSTMDSEMETDSDLRVNKEFTSSSINSQQFENQVEHLHSVSSDSRYTGDSTISDDAYSSSKKKTPSFLSSDSPITSATKNPHSHEISAEGNAPADVPETGVDDAVSENMFDGFQVEQLSKRSFDDTCKDAVAKNRSGFEHQVRQLGETVSTSDDEGRKEEMIMDVPCSPGVSGSNSQPGNGSPQVCSGEHLVDEPNSENEPFMSYVSDVICHAPGGSAAISDYLLSDNDYDHKDLSQFDNMESMLNIRIDISQNIIDNAKMNNIENPHPGMSDDEVPTLTENISSDDTDNNDNGGRITLKLSEVEKLQNKLDNEGSNVISDTSKHYLCMEASLGKELTETSLAKGIIVDTKDHCSDSSISNQIISETLIVPSAENSPDWEEAALDAHDKDFISEEETTANVTPKVGTPESLEVIEMQEMGLSYNFSLTPNDAVALGNSCCVQEYLGNPTVTLHIIADGEIDRDKDVSGLKVREISAYEGTKLSDEVHDLLGESYPKTNKLGNGAASSPAPAESGNAIRENVDVLLDMVEENINSSSVGESADKKKNLSGSLLQETGFVEDDIDYLSETRTESGLTKEVCAGEASTSKFSCPIVNDYDQPTLEVTLTVTNTFVDSGVNTTEAQSSNENKCGCSIDTDEDFFQKNGNENQIPDATSLYVNCNAEKRVSEKIKIPPANQIDEELPNSGERILDSSSPVPMNHPQTLDHDLSVSGLPEARNYDLHDPGYPKDQIGFIFPSRNIFTEINQVNLAELPPLPPLPPVEWRRGRLQHALSTAVGELGKPVELFPEEIFPYGTSIGDISSSLEETNHALCADVSEKMPKEQKIEKMSKEQKIEQELFPEEISPYGTSIGDISSSLEETNHALCADVSEKMPKEQKIEKMSKEQKIEQELFPEEISPYGTLIVDISSSLEETNHALCADVSEKMSKEQKIEKMSKEQKIEQELFISHPESGEITSPSEEGEVANESQTVKPPLPPNPLIESIADLDKSKLRKVTERVRPEIQKADERDALLEQIKAKSFNLRPAVASRPTIKGPQTNLKVAAILERANAIRQAFVGSDEEEEEDNWSDS